MRRVLRSFHKLSSLIMAVVINVTCYNLFASPTFPSWRIYRRVHSFFSENCQCSVKPASRCFNAIQVGADYRSQSVRRSYAIYLSRFICLCNRLRTARFVIDKVLLRTFVIEILILFYYRERVPWDKCP